MTQLLKERLVHLECSLLRLEAEQDKLNVKRIQKRRTYVAGQILTLLGVLLFTQNPFYVIEYKAESLFVPVFFILVGLITWILGIDNSPKMEECKAKILATQLEFTQLKYQAEE